MSEHDSTPISALAPADFVTVLTHRSIPLAKRWLTDGTISPYQNAKDFWHEGIDVIGIRHLSGTLQQLEQRPDSCVIRGRYAGPAELTSAPRRREFFEDVPHHWVLLDVDGYEPVCADPVADPEAAIQEFVVACLPDVFWEITCHWQLSNSAGHPSNAGKLKAHLWFWIAQPYTSAQLKRWVKKLWPDASKRPVDAALLNVVQIHYTSAPLFDEGVADPVAKRSGLLPGIFGDEVWLELPEDCLYEPEVASGGGEGDERAVLDSQLEGALAALAAHYSTIGACPREDWLHVGMALHHETGGSAEGMLLWDWWSAQIPGYEGIEDVETRWDSFGQGYSGPLVTGGTILKLARDAGWADLPGDDEFAQPPVVTGGDGGTLEPDLPRFDRWRLGPRVKYANRIDPELNALLLALETPEMAGGYLAYDDFLQATVRINGTAQRVDESMLGFIRADLESGRFPGAHFAPINSTALYDAANLVARRQRVDSAKAWAESLVWDGVPRVSSFYERHMHVREEDVENGYARAMSRYMWTAMAGRALLPGCKADTTPIWVDPRGGVGKSTLVAALSPQEDWVTGVHLGQLHNRKDALVRNMKGKLIGELSELRGLNTASAEDIKAFMTASVDDVHIMYSNDTGYFKRRIFFIGTTNEVDFISRMQGDRRLGPIMVGTDGRAIDVAAIVAEREQLWAEAVVLYKAHGVLWRDLTGMLAKAHEEFLTIDEWHQEIEKWLLGTTDQIMDGGEVGVRADREWTSSEILSGALVIPVNRQSRKDTVRVNNIMRQLGFEQYMPRERNGKQVRKWRRIRRKN